MRNLYLTIAILALAAFATSAGPTKGREQESASEVIVWPLGKDQSKQQVSALVHGLGEVERFDKGVKGFIVKVEGRSTPQRLEAKLKGKAKVTEIHPREEDEEVAEKPEAEEMREDYLRRRQGPDGQVDWASYPREIAHRDAMETGHIGAIPLERTPGDFSGLWDYIGPTKFTGPNRTYYGNFYVSGRINAIAYDPLDENTLYAGAADGGVWKTTDMGNTWTPLSDNWPHLNVSCITMDPTNHLTLYVGTGDYPGSFGAAEGSGKGYGIGIMKSTDGGQTWDPAVQTASATAFGSCPVSSIIVDPDNANIIIATTGRGIADTGRVWRSTNGGLNWANTGLTSSQWCSSAVGIKSGTNPRIIYVASGNPKPFLVYSEDGGATWKSMTVPVGATRMADPYDSIIIAASAMTWNRLYLMVNAAGGGGVATTGDLGGHWFDITGNYESDAVGKTKYNWSQAFYNYFLGCYARYNSTTNSYQDALIAGNIDVQANLNPLANHWSSLGGPTWSSTGSYVHNDQHAVAFSHQNSEHMAFGCDGGIYFGTFDTNAGTINYTAGNPGLGITQLYNIDVAPTNQYSILAAAQDNGTPTTLPSPASASAFTDWNQTTAGGDGTVVAFTSNPKVAFCSNFDLDLYRTSDGGSTWSYMSYESLYSDGLYYTFSKEPRLFVAPIAVDNTHGYLYGGTNHVWQYNIAKGTWAECPNPVVTAANGAVSTIAISSDGARLLAGGTDGSVWMSTDGDYTWKSILGDMPWSGRFVSAISVSPLSNKDVLVATSTAGTRNLWRCTDVTAATPHWVDVNGPGSGVTALVQSPVNSIARDFDSPATEWYIATDIGVFTTEDAGATWQQVTNALGLPNVQVNSLVAHAQSREVYAGTYGRGIWRIYNKPVGMHVSFAPASVALGNQTYLNITFDKPVPETGYDIALHDTDPTTAPMPPSNVLHINGGSQGVSWLVTIPATGKTGLVTVYATIGETKVSSTLDVIVPAVNGNVVSQNPIFGGSDFPSWTITLPSVAGQGGLSVLAESSNNSVIKPQFGYFTFPEGYQSSSMALNTFPVAANTNVSLSVYFSGGHSTVVVLVKPILITSLTLDNSSVFGGTTDVNGTLNLNYSSPTNPTTGCTATVTTSNTAAASLDSSKANIPSGYYAVNFAIHTHPVAVDTNVTITVTLNGVSKTQVLTVRRNYPTKLAIDNTSPFGGVDMPNCTVSLETTAATDTYEGAKVLLKSSSTAAATVPASLAIPAGYQSSGFTVTTLPVGANTNVTISATLNGVTVSQLITVKAEFVSSVQLSTYVAVGGSDQATGTVNLNYQALNATGTTVALTSSVPAAASVPPSIVVPAGYTSNSFSITTYPVTADVSVTITANLNGALKTATLVVRAVKVTSLKLTETTAVGGTDQPQGTVNLSYAAPSPKGSTVTLTSSAPAAASVPSSMNVPAGYQANGFQMTTYPVTASTAVTITATLNGSSQTAVLTVVPILVTAVSVAPTTAVGGVDQPTGAVNINFAAPSPNGAKIGLGSSAPSVASVPASVIVPAGYYSNGFPVTTHAVTASTTVTITAAANGSSQKTTLVVKPATTLLFDGLSRFGEARGVNASWFALDLSMDRRRPG